MINQSEDDPVYLEWLAAAPKGVRWDRAQEMYKLFQERRAQQARAIALRLLGKKVCFFCDGTGSAVVHECYLCSGTGELDA